MDRRKERRRRICRDWIDVGDRVKIKEILEINGKPAPPERRALRGKEGVVLFRDGTKGRCMVEFDNGGLSSFCVQEELERISLQNGHAR